jgi:PKD repeat protein
VAPGLVELARAADGTLRASDCIQQAGAVSQTCTDTSGHGLGDALGVVVSPDGANVYVASSSSGGAIAAFSRAGGGTPPPPPSNQAPTGAFSETASGLAVSFDASGSSDPDGTIASYAWDFGDGAHGTGVTAAHTYAGGGTYTAVLTVTDDDGAASTASHDVTASAPVTQAPSGQAPPPQLVEFPPAAHIALSPTRGNKRTSFAFSAAGSLGRIASYVWDFGDGATASTRDATHVYGRVGTFTAGLTVRDSSGRSSTAHTQVTVRNALPIPAFTYHSGTGRTLAFNAFGSADADGRVVSYRWAFGDGAVGRGLTLRHRYRGTRTRYTVTLIAVDDSTARGEIRRSISVVPGAGDVSIVEAIAVEDAPVITPPSNVLVDETIGVSDVPSLVPPSSITVVENIGASDGTVPIHHPSPRRLSNQQRRKR